MVSLTSHAGPNQVGSNRLSRRSPFSFRIIASELLLPVVVTIGQLYIDLTLGVEILGHEQSRIAMQNIALFEAGMP
jgi:hypothetical protein